jgi:uncharacterized protein (DUF2147 family)
MFQKRSFILFIFLVVSLPVFSQAPDVIVSKWLNASGEGQIMIFRKGEKYFGRLVWLKDLRDGQGQIKRDTKNPDPDLRKRPLLGIEILKDFDYLDAGGWGNGTIYDPKTGKTYSCKMTIQNNNNQLSIRGYVGISLLGRTEIWKKVH